MNLRTLLISIIATISLITFTKNTNIENREITSKKVAEIKEEEIIKEEENKLKVEFMLVTPCIENTECYEFNDEILEITSNFYKEYNIDINFIRKKIGIAKEISVNYDSKSPEAYGYKLKLELIRATKKDMPHILHAPMFKDNQKNRVLGVANQYLELIILDQEMMNRLKIKEEAHVLIHEIGHIFGLKDIYNEKSCNFMDGVTRDITLFCQRVTKEQIERMYYSIINFLNK